MILLMKITKNIMLIIRGSGSGKTNALLNLTKQQDSDSLIDKIYLYARDLNENELTLRKIPQFHLISWCGNFVERHSFRIVSGETPETMRKLCLSTEFPH